MSGASRDEEVTDAHWLAGRTATRGVGAALRPRALHLEMRDGVRIAIDVYVPETGKPAPTIIRQTRYLRRLEASPWFRWLGATKAFDLYERTRRVFLAAGYAWVDVDVRGTGASTGVWLCPWSPDEVRDGAEVVDWVVRQPWSNGRVGSLGTSYDGTAAEMLLTARHPAVRAVAPMYALFDVYTDVAFPGGIPLKWFTERWTAYNADLDAGRWSAAASLTLWLMARAARASTHPTPLERVVGGLARSEKSFRGRIGRLLGRVVRGVGPVAPLGPGTPSPEELAARSRNMDVHLIAQHVTFRDDAGALAELPDGTIDLFSPHALLRDVEVTAAVYSYSGWRDGAYPHAAVKRFLTVRSPASRLTIGPWSHAGKLRIRPFDMATLPDFDHDAELLAFFDEHVQGQKPHGDDGQPVHYYTMVEGRWKAATTWPPPGTIERVLHLGPERSLREEPPCDGFDEHEDKGDAGTGERSRWRSLLSVVPGDYPDRAKRDGKLLLYEGEPLDGDVEVTGHPVAVLFMSWANAEAAHVFVYLEDVAPDGRVAYVTEGQLATLHRRLASAPYAFETPAPQHGFRRADASPALAPNEIVEMTLGLLPISWLFRSGHRIRLAIAGADADHFAVAAPRTFRVHRTLACRSKLVLPVMPGR